MSEPMEEPRTEAASAEGTAAPLGTPAEEGRRVAKATGLLGGLTVLSRLLGLLRDMGQAAVLGTGLSADAFTLAFIIPNIIRRLFGESTVSAAFVPTYTETLVTESREDAVLLARRVVTFVFCVLAVLVGLGMLFAPQVVRAFAPGFAQVAGKTELTAGLLRLLFPYILFVGTAAVFGGILHSHRHFLSPALAPIAFNIAAISGLFLLGRQVFPRMPVWGYAIGVAAGGLLQLLVQLPAASSRGFTFRPAFGWRSPRVRRVGRLALPALIGLIAAEVNILVDQMIASLLEPGSVAALSYGNRIMYLPLGAFAVALATALLPTLSRQTAMGRLDEARQTLSRATLGLAMLLLPTMICLVVMAEPIVRVVLARGAFSSRSVALTSTALLFYAPALVSWGGVRITVPVFYAMKNTRTPVKISVFCMGLNIVLNIVLTQLFIRTGLARPLAGLALASSLSALVNFLALRRRLSARLGKGPRGGVRAWMAVAAAFAATAPAVWLASGPVDAAMSASAWAGAAAVAGVAAGAIVLFSAVTLALGGGQARALVSMVLRRGR
jgi:putative peptidoglycan lipid II flippase